MHTKQFLKRFSFNLLIGGAILATPVASLAQSVPIMIPPTPTFPSFSRTIAGTISLDSGVADRDYMVEITITKRSFSFGPPPSFSISYPILDTETTKVSILEGRSSANYVVSGISTIGFNNLVIEMECAGCNAVIPRQYYTLSGNKFSFSSQVVLDGDDVPDRLNLTLTTGTSVFGTISLDDNQPAPRDLRLQLIGIPSRNPSFFVVSDVIELKQGENSLSYQLGGFRPDLGGDLEVSLACDNCEDVGRDLITFKRKLRIDRNNFDVNFVLRPTANLAGIMQLLLLDE